MTDTDETPGRSPEELEALYDRATDLFARLWPLSRGRGPWDDALAGEARAAASEIETALSDIDGDYDELRRLWAQDMHTLSEPLRLKAGEVVFRNLCDVQDDLLRVLGAHEPGLMAKLEGGASAPEIVARW